MLSEIPTKLFGVPLICFLDDSGAFVPASESEEALKHLRPVLLQSLRSPKNYEIGSWPSDRAPRFRGGFSTLRQWIPSVRFPDQGKSY